MKYVVEVDGVRMDATVDGDRVELGGTSETADLTTIEGTPVRLVRVGHRVYRAVVRRRLGRGHYVLWIDGFTYEVEALDERTRTIRDLAAAAAGPPGPANLHAPMPGLVVRLLVQPGDTVAAGQGLVVIEAMKMENELRAAGAGRVRAIAVSPGTAVEKGAILVEMEG